MSLIARTCAVGAAVGALAAMPAGAVAQSPEPQHIMRFGGAVPTRVAQRVRRAERALARADDHVTDGDSTTAITALATVQRALAAALKSAERHTSDDSGPASFAAVARAQDDVAQGTAEMLDGAGDDLTSALATTLKAALDGHDKLVSDVGALSADDQEDFAGVLEQIASQADDEVDAFKEGVEDDTLTDAGKSAEAAAATQAAATSSAAEALYDALDGADTESVAYSDGGPGDCPGGPRPGGPGSGPGV